MWEELNNYKPRCSCGHCLCGGVKDVQNYFDNEYVMTFIMGLNDSFSHVRGQLLLMEPLPVINKVFSLVLQEERQRRIITPLSTVDASSTLAFHVQTPRPKKGSSNYSAQNSFRGIKKDRPYCTKCQVNGHTIDKCYKIHGYPPGYHHSTRQPIHATV